MSYNTLNAVSSPDDLKKLNMHQLYKYCSEAREFLLDSVSKTGGHLSSSLGVVELTVAIHKVFNSPSDKIIWDVGHQSYVHKLITGRKDKFDTLRREGGLSGFTRQEESPHDSFISGHSSTSISAAVGMARASQLLNEDNYTIAVIGDGAFTGGMAYEALNNAGNLDKLIVILNHNAMSISKNVGSFAKYLSVMRSKPAYLRLKTNVNNLLDKTPVVGGYVKSTLKTGKKFFKNAILHSTFFESFGFMYLGPVDGHNLSELVEALTYAKKSDGPIFILVDTVKGKGYSYAEENPGAYHGVPKFNIENGNPDISSCDSFSTVAGKMLCELARTNDKICAVTAAMKYGTGLQFFSSEFKNRFFDVGIAEQHAVTFCAGLASKGFVPVFAVYSTFLQRCFDQILHDCSIEKKHIVLLVDRAGIVGDDGETHQGLFDVALMNMIPGVIVYSPSNYRELKQAIKKAIYEHDDVVIVRYPKGAESGIYPSIEESLCDYRIIGENKNDNLIITFGRLFDEAHTAQKKLAKQGKDISILKLNRITCLPDVVYDVALNYKNIYFYEEGILQGGIGETFESELYRKGYKGNFKITAIDNKFIPQATIYKSLHLNGLDSESMIKSIKGEQTCV